MEYNEAQNLLTQAQTELNEYKQSQFYQDPSTRDDNYVATLNTAINKLTRLIHMKDSISAAQQSVAEAQKANDAADKYEQKANLDPVQRGLVAAGQSAAGIIAGVPSAVSSVALGAGGTLARGVGMENLGKAMQNADSYVQEKLDVGNPFEGYEGPIGAIGGALHGFAGFAVPAMGVGKLSGKLSAGLGELAKSWELGAKATSRITTGARLLGDTLGFGAMSLRNESDKIEAQRGKFSIGRSLSAAAADSLLMSVALMIGSGHGLTNDKQIEYGLSFLNGKGVLKLTKEAFKNAMRGGLANGVLSGGLGTTIKEALALPDNPTDADYERIWEAVKENVPHAAVTGAALSAHSAVSEYKSAKDIYNKLGSTRTEKLSSLSQMSFDKSLKELGKEYPDMWTTAQTPEKIAEIQQRLISKIPSDLNSADRAPINDLIKDVGTMLHANANSASRLGKELIDGRNKADKEVTPTEKILENIKSAKKTISEIDEQIAKEKDLVVQQQLVKQKEAIIDNIEKYRSDMEHPYTFDDIVVAAFNGIGDDATVKTLLAETQQIYGGKRFNGDEADRLLTDIANTVASVRQAETKNAGSRLANALDNVKKSKAVKDINTSMNQAQTGSNAIVVNPQGEALLPQMQGMNSSDIAALRGQMKQTRKAENREKSAASYPEKTDSELGLTRALAVRGVTSPAVRRGENGVIYGEDETTPMSALPPRNESAEITDSVNDSSKSKPTVVSPSVKTNSSKLSQEKDEKPSPKQPVKTSVKSVKPTVVKPAEVKPVETKSTTAQPTVKLTGKFINDSRAYFTTSADYEEGKINKDTYIANLNAVRESFSNLIKNKKLAPSTRSTINDYILQIDKTLESLDNPNKPDGTNGAKPSGGSKAVKGKGKSSPAVKSSGNKAELTVEPTVGKTVPNKLRLTLADVDKEEDFYKLATSGKAYGKPETGVLANAKIIDDAISKNAKNNPAMSPKVVEERDAGGHLQYRIEYLDDSFPISDLEAMTVMEKITKAQVGISDLPSEDILFTSDAYRFAKAAREQGKQIVLRAVYSNGIATSRKKVSPNEKNSFLVEFTYKETGGLKPSKDSHVENMWVIDKEETDYLNKANSIVNQTKNPVKSGAKPNVSVLAEKTKNSIPFRQGGKAKIDSRTMNLNADYVLVDADNVKTFNDVDYKYQDRKRAGNTASEMQINNISRGMKPYKIITTSPDAGNGLPVFDPEWNTLAGNGRITAIRQMYENYPEVAAEFKKYMRDHAQEFGLSSEEIDKIKKPIIGRKIRDGELKNDNDFMKFVSESNENEKLAFNASEKARSDARKIGDILGLFNASSKIESRENFNFINQFIKLTGANTGEMLQGEELSAEGKKRIENALIATVLGKNPRLVEKITNSTNEDINRIRDSIYEVIGDSAKLTSEIKKGFYWDVDINGILSDSLQAYFDAMDIKRGSREYNGVPITTVITDNLTNLKLSEPKAKVITLLSNLKSKTRTISLLRHMNDALRDKGSPNQLSFDTQFDENGKPILIKPTEKDIIDEAIARFDAEYRTKFANLDVKALVSVSNDGRLFRKGKKPSSRLPYSKEKIAAALKNNSSLVKDGKVKVFVVDKLSDIPGSKNLGLPPNEVPQDISYGKDGVTYIVRENIPDGMALETVSRHAIGAHLGAPRILGNKTYDKMCEYLANSKNKEIQSLAETILAEDSSVRGDNVKLGKEIFARVFEKGLNEPATLKGKMKQLWQDIKFFFKRGLRRLGYNGDISEDELNAAMRYVYKKSLEKGSTSFTQGIDKVTGVAAKNTGIPKTARVPLNTILESDKGKSIKPLDKSRIEAIHGENPLYRMATKEEEDELNKDEYVYTYRNMQVLRVSQGKDGKWFVDPKNGKEMLFPPIAAYFDANTGKTDKDGKPLPKKMELVEPSLLKKWYRSDERYDNVKRDEDGNVVIRKAHRPNEFDHAVIDLNKYQKEKKNGEAGTTKALRELAFNAYFHSKSTPWNFQFTEAGNRPNLVVVEMAIPKKDLESGYRAKYSKNAVGYAEWKSDAVSDKLSEAGVKLDDKLILSRWGRIERIVPNEEVADKIAELFGNSGVGIPENRVVPAMKPLLEARGIKILPPDTKLKGDKPLFRMAGPSEQVSAKTVEETYGKNKDGRKFDVIVKKALRANLAEFEEKNPGTFRTQKRPGYTVAALRSTYFTGYDMSKKRAEATLKQIKVFSRLKEGVSKYAEANLPSDLRSGILKKIINAKTREGVLAIVPEINALNEKHIRQTAHTSFIQNMMDLKANKISTADTLLKLDVLRNHFTQEELDSLTKTDSFTKPDMIKMRNVAKIANQIFASMSDNTDLAKSDFQIMSEGARATAEKLNSIIENMNLGDSATIPTETLIEVNNMLHQIKVKSDLAKQQIVKDAKNKAFEAQKQIRKEMKPIDEKFANSKEGKSIGVFNNYLKPGSSLSVKDNDNFFRDMGPTMRKLGSENIRKGQAVMEHHLAKGNRVIDKIFEDFGGDRGLKEKFITKKTDGGHTYDLDMNDAMYISAMWNDRETRAVIRRKGKVAFELGEKPGSETIEFTVAELEKLDSQLSELQKNSIAAGKKLLFEYLPELNRVREKLEGVPFRTILDGTYAPRVHIGEGTETSSLGVLDAMSAPFIVEAKNADWIPEKKMRNKFAIPKFRLRGWTNVLETYKNHASLYIGMAEPLRELNRVYDRDMKRDIIQRYGKEYANRLEMVVRHEAGQAEKTPSDKNIMQKYLSNIAAAKLTPLSALKQFTSIPLASSIIDKKYLFKALAGGMSKENIEDMMSLDSMSIRYRDGITGVHETGARNLEERHALANISNSKFIKGALSLSLEADKRALGIIFKAAKLQAESEGKGRERAVELFQKAVDRTQNTTDLANANGFQLMSRESTHWAFLNMYLNQTQKIPNEIMRLYRDVKEAEQSENKEGLPEAKSRLVDFIISVALMEAGQIGVTAATASALGRKNDDTVQDVAVNAVTDLIGNPILKPAVSGYNLKNVLNGRKPTTSNVFGNDISDIAPNVAYDFQQVKEGLENKDIRKTVESAIGSKAVQSALAIGKIPTFLANYPAQIIKNYFPKKKAKKQAPKKKDKSFLNKKFWDLLSVK